MRRVDSLSLIACCVSVVLGTMTFARAEEKAAQPAKAKPTRTRAKRPPRKAANVDIGFLTVNARPWVKVFVNGKQVASETPLRNHRLAAGTHKLTVVNAASGFKVQRKIKISPNKTLSIFVDVQKGTLNLQ